MAGYSGTPLVKKLGIKEGARVAFVNAFAGFDGTLGELPAGVTEVPVAEGDLDVVVCFVADEAEVGARFAELKPLLRYTGGLWFAWPKKTSGMASSLSENIIRDIGLAAGLVDNKVCAVDERWSGLRFVYRLADRPK